jgi:hypothetical protein
MGHRGRDASGDRIQWQHRSLGTVEGARIRLGRNHCSLASADALKDVFPFTKKQKAASVHAIALSSMFIDAQLEWENIFSGKYTDEEIMNRRHNLMKLQHDAERGNFSDGLAVNDGLFSEAQQEATEYFKATYDV